MHQRGAVFFDLCGTLGEDDGHIRSFRLYPWAGAALRLLAEAGIPAAVLTNQSGIARGRFSQLEFDAAMGAAERELSVAGVTWPRVYCCPHGGGQCCGCRKPNTGLARQAAEREGLDLARSFMVGDSGHNDMLLARAIGATAILVRTGWGEGSLTEYRRLWAGVEADHVAADALAAVRWILSQTDWARLARPGA